MDEDDEDEEKHRYCHSVDGRRHVLYIQVLSYECGSENEYRDMDALVANVLKVTHANTHINRQHEK